MDTHFPRARGCSGDRLVVVVESLDRKRDDVTTWYGRGFDSVED
jgi:hypothetical protein